MTVTDVRATAAILWARAPQAGEVAIEVGVLDGAPRRLARAARAADDHIVRLPLDGLAPATRHRYRVSQGADQVEGTFTTAPAPEDPGRVTFLWSGDLGGGGSFCRALDGGYKIFRAMARQAADFFVFAGDTVYADAPCNRPDTVPGANFRATTLAEYRARHRYNREDPAFQEFLRRTSVVATWDDHDVRNDFSGTIEPSMPVGRQAFLDYWPAAAGDDPHRLHRSLRWGRLLEVFVLDTRQYRSDNRLLDGPGKTMLGAAQRRWLLDAVPASTALWKVVVSSVPLAIPTGKPERRDSWSNANVFGLVLETGTGFAIERDAILRHFRERRVKNLVFLAADVHHAEIIRHQPSIRWEFHEFIAGPLSATPGRPRPLDEGLRPHSLFAQGGIMNFGEVTIDPAHLVVRLMDEEGRPLFTHTLTPEQETKP